MSNGALALLFGESGAAGAPVSIPDPPKSMLLSLDKIRFWIMIILRTSDRSVG